MVAVEVKVVAADLDERDVVGVFILVVSEKWLFAERTTAATGPMESFSVDVWDWV